MKIPFFTYLCIASIFFFCENTSNDKILKENKEVEKKVRKIILSQNETNSQKNILDTPFIRKIACENIKHHIPKHIKNVFLAAKKDTRKMLKIVCFGNSITRGFKVGSYQPVENPYPKVLENLLKKDIPQIEVLNEGHNGWRTDHALNHIRTKVLVKNPQIVFLEFGINDAYSNFSQILFEQNSLKIIDILQKNNIIPIILTPTPITSSYREQVEKYCEVLYKISLQQNITFINLQKEITKRAIKQNIGQKKLLPDEVHFGDKFYAWIAEIIYENMVD